MIKERQKKVKSILISQPEPENKTPYHSLAEKHKVKLYYRSFIQVDELTTMEFSVPFNIILCIDTLSINL